MNGSKAGENEMIRYIGKFIGITLGILPFYLLLRRPWQKKSRREWALGGFILYTAALLALALEGTYGNPVWMAREAVRRIRTREGINLIPFRTVRNCFTHFTFDGFMVNIVGNIVMFMPWGFGLVLLWRKKRTFGAVILYSIALPLLIETSQLFIGRNVDVDDLILNFAGSCLGAGFYCLLRKVVLCGKPLENCC